MYLGTRHARLRLAEVAPEAGVKYQAVKRLAQALAAGAERKRFVSLLRRTLSTTKSIHGAGSGMGHDRVWSEERTRSGTHKLLRLLVLIFPEEGVTCTLVCTRWPSLN